jgi:Regulator of chromosome condensation (RCC1) repeat
VADGGDQEPEVRVVEAGHGVAEGYGGAGGDAGGELEDAALAAAGGKASRVQASMNAAKFVPGFVNATSISAGPYASMAVASGRLWAWGDNADGQIGNGNTGGIISTPQEIPGLTGVVNLSVGDLPAGVTASFSDSAPDASASSVLTLTAGQWSPGGVFPITVNGSAGSFSNPVSASATFDLTIRPGLAVTLSPTDGMVIASGSVTSQVTITVGSGFGNAVNLTVSNLPDGTTASLSSTDSIATPVTLTLTCSGTPGGQYDIHVNATSPDGTRTSTAIFELTITGQADRGGN